MQKGNVLKPEQATQGLISYRGRSEYESTRVSLFRVQRSSFDKGCVPFGESKNGF